jgi:hypothetical protein
MNSYKRSYQWRIVWFNGSSYRNVGLNTDGSLYNPNGHPNEAELLSYLTQIVADREEEKRQRRVAGAKRAVITRARRRQRLIWQAANKLVQDENTGPAVVCICCRKKLTDPASIGRGIGSECWQHVLDTVERIKIGAREKEVT